MVRRAGMVELGWKIWDGGAGMEEPGWRSWDGGAGTEEPGWNSRDGAAGYDRKTTWKFRQKSVRSQVK